MSTFNCLALSGGGVRGLIALYQLNYLYKKMGGEFFRHFDYVGGTSTGALIAALIAKQKTPVEIIDIYERELPKIFEKKCLRQIRGLSKYDNKYLKGLATELIGETRLGDLKQKILIPTVNTTKEETKIFKSHDEKDADFKLVDVIIASAAAPTYFPAYQIGDDFYKDGGLSSNNPADILLTECLLQEAKKVNIISITTGHVQDTVTKAEKKGNLLSVPEMIDEVLNLQDLKSHGNVLKQYEALRKTGNLTGTYRRCESIVKHSSGAIDDVSRVNIENMKKDGELSVLKNKAEIDIFYLATLKND